MSIEHTITPGKGQQPIQDQSPVGAELLNIRGNYIIMVGVSTVHKVSMNWAQSNCQACVSALGRFKYVIILT